ncbi:DNA-binding transcriptional regulator, LysR family [Thermosyntropha lipolytica DSM 11003]|uniref:DNA-binding transcriptional regulator, LysR family n=1 Tax=Thermosyntropha lipolytica DSM 11003 TaxID=1123382 RepID=A0A1M5LKX6_9FIRM|nr:LysR family transcriptional regulator [Thermosyntropha lipolytica]SHG65701.1 DNA-binding transcriptional regulator, LysR family [Thermosyntropha lipolytica DSM 11003]
MYLNPLSIIPIVAETKSFSKAARILHLSQPAISSKIKDIEDYYGLKIFHRTAQGVTLTEAGKIINAYAVRFAELQQAMDEELKQLLQNNSILTIGASCTVGNYAMPSCIKIFKDRYPDITVKLDISNSRGILEKLHRKEIDVAVIEGSTENPDLAVYKITDTRLVFIVSLASRIVKKKEISLTELSSKPFVIREKGAAVRQIFEKALADHGYSLEQFNIVTEMTSIHAVKAAVQDDIGISIVPEITIKKEINNQLLKTVKVTGLDLYMPIHLAYLKNEELSLPAQRFVNLLLHPQKSIFCWENKVFD